MGPRAWRGGHRGPGGAGDPSRHILALPHGCALPNLYEVQPFCLSECFTWHLWEEEHPTYTHTGMSRLLQLSFKKISSPNSSLHILLQFVQFSAICLSWKVFVNPNGTFHFISYYSYDAFNQVLLQHFMWRIGMGWRGFQQLPLQIRQLPLQSSIIL